MLTSNDRTRPVVLVADDEPQVLRLLELTLEGRGFEVLAAACGAEAVAAFRQNHDAIDLVLLDVRMAGDLDGPQTLAALKQIDAGVPCCFLTGQAGDYDTEGLLRAGAARVFRKPFDGADLARELRRLLGADGTIRVKDPS